MTPKQNFKPVLIRLPQELIDLADTIAEAKFMDRTELIRTLIREEAYRYAQEKPVPTPAELNAITERERNDSNVLKSGYVPNVRGRATNQDTKRDDNV